MAPQEARGGGSAPTTSGGSSVWTAWAAWAPGRRDGAGGEDRQRLLELSPSATELLGSEGSGGPAQALRRARLRVGGMVCSACSGAVEGALRRTAGVESASVALATGECLVTYFDGLLSAEALAAAVEDAGFEASLVEDGKLPPPAGGAPAPDGGGGPRLTTLGLAVGGMTCSSCAGSVERALRAVPGVKGVAVNLLQNSAQVTFDPDATGPRTVLEAVEDAGFEARVEDQAGAGAGAGSRDASREEIRKWRRLLVQAAWLAAPLFLLAMVGPHVPPAKRLLDAQVLGFPVGTLLKWALATPLQFGIGWRFYVGAWKALRRGSANMDVLVALGTSAAYGYSCLSVLYHHFQGHHARHSYQPTDFFETSGLLITFILLGKFLEARAKSRTSAAIVKLLNLAPPTAVLVRPAAGGGEEEVEIASRLIHRGDRLKVAPGANVPADGRVVRGESYVDEAMITGESLPIHKQAGDEVIGGTVNTTGALVVEATRVGADTSLAQIVRLVEHAQMSKAPIQGLADRISAVFVPIIVGLAVLTFLAWYAAGRLGWYPTGAGPESWLPAGHSVFLFALMFAIGVVVVACPCALGLATPTAVMVGTGVGAANGLLIKGGDALERAHRVNAVVFDKTGTLTLGKPAVVDHLHLPASQVPEPRFWDLVAAAEGPSEHPLAAAVTRHARERAAPAGGPRGLGGPPRPGPPRATGWAARPGLGVTCTVVPEEEPPPPAAAAGDGGGVSVAVGSRKLMGMLGVAVPAAVEEWLRTAEGRAATAVLVAVAGRVAGAVAVADALKPEARGVVQALRAMGIECHMATGDNWLTARVVANAAGVTEVHAELSPEQKVDTVQKLQAGRRVVAMVGDGINDSPALAAADIGMAIGSGTDVAIEAADYVLMKDDLEDVLMAFDLSRRTFNRIKLNYVWAFLYNCLSVPIAAGALYPFTRVQLPPWIGGATMALSSVCVVTSSLLLQRYRKPAPVLRGVEARVGGD